MKNISLLFLMIAVLASCTKKEEIAPKIFVSVLPQKFFVEKIVGNEIEVEVMVKPGMSPATYEPLPTQMLQLSKSKLYCSIGVPFEENWLHIIEKNNKDLVICKTDEGIVKRNFSPLLEIESDEHHHGHDHGHNHGHDHGAAQADPHIWLNPLLVKKQSASILESLVKLFPARKEKFNGNYKKFVNELDSIDQELTQILSDYEGEKFLVFHPSWGYFADQYNLKQIAVEVEGKEPSPKELTQIIDKAKELNLTKIFVQEQFSAKAAEAVAGELKSKLVKIDPLAYNYFDNLIYFANNIAGKVE